MASLEVIFAGSGEFGLPTLRALEAAGHRLVQVFSQPDRPAGRGRKMTPTPVATYAIERGLSLVRTANINAETLPKADVMVVIAFGQKIDQRVVNHPRMGSVNLHASRLPQFRGAAPINAAILAGEMVTGNSIIRLAQKMDAGAVLAQSRVEIGELETAGELHDRLAEDGAPLMMATLVALANGTAKETVQDESAATIAPKMSRDSARIDWSQPADIIARRIRGLYPWPGCRVRLLNAQKNDIAHLTLVRGRAIDRLAIPAGTIDADGHIGTVHGSIEIVELQPEGKRPMPLSAYRNGHPWNAGMTLEPIT